MCTTYLCASPQGRPERYPSLLQGSHRQGAITGIVYPSSPALSSSLPHYVRPTTGNTMVQPGPYAISDKRPGIATDIFDANHTSIVGHTFLAGDDQKFFGVVTGELEDGIKVDPPTAWEIHLNDVIPGTLR